MDKDSYERVGDVVKNFVDTVDFNLTEVGSKAVGKVRAHRIFTGGDQGAGDYEKFRAYINERCQALLEDIDNWIARLDLPTKSDSTIRTSFIPVSVFITI